MQPQVQKLRSLGCWEVDDKTWPCSPPPAAREKNLVFSVQNILNENSPFQVVCVETEEMQPELHLLFAYEPEPPQVKRSA